MPFAKRVELEVDCQNHKYIDYVDESTSYRDEAGYKSHSKNRMLTNASLQSFKIFRYFSKN